MPNLAKIAAIETKLGIDSAVSESTPEGTPAPPDAPSGVGSAAAGNPAAGDAPGGGDAAPAAVDHSELERKLAQDRARREEKARRKRIIDDEAAAKRAREEAEAEKAKWSGVGKEKTFLETIKALGKDPVQAFEEMKKEALAAGTPDAKIEALERVFSGRVEALEKQLAEERDARATEKKTASEERQRAQAAHEERAFQTDFSDTLKESTYESLLEEYEPRQLYPFVADMRDNRDKLFASAKALGVGLTFKDGRFNMQDILNVLKAQQAAHFARIEEQRRKKGAAPQTSIAGNRKPAEGKSPTVNGTAERNAGTSLGNSVASARATDAVSHKGESREQRIQRLARKYG